MRCTRRSDRQCPSRIVADCCCRRHDRSCYGRSSWPRLSPDCGGSPPPPAAPSYPPPEVRRTSTCSNLFFCNLFLIVYVCAFVSQRQIYFVNRFCSRENETDFAIVQIVQILECLKFSACENSNVKHPLKIKFLA